MNADFLEFSDWFHNNIIAVCKNHCLNISVTIFERIAWQFLWYKTYQVGQVVYNLLSTVMIRNLDNFQAIGNLSYDTRLSAVIIFVNFTGASPPVRFLMPLLGLFLSMLNTKRKIQKSNGQTLLRVIHGLCSNDEGVYVSMQNYLKVITIPFVSIF